MNTGDININNINIGNRVNIGNRNTNINKVNINRPNNIYNRPDNRVRNHSATPYDSNRLARPVSGKSNNIYAGANGDVLRNTGNGWEKRSGNNWEQLPNGGQNINRSVQNHSEFNTQHDNFNRPYGNVNRDFQARQMGNRMDTMNRGAGVRRSR